MASITDIYGQDYKKEASDGRIKHTIGIIAKNLSADNYGFITDSKVLWNGCDIPVKYQNELIRLINSPRILIKFLNKRNPEHIKTLPYLISGPVEYCYIIDKVKSEMYFIYITIQQVGVLCSSTEIDVSTL